MSTSSSADFPDAFSVWLVTLFLAFVAISNLLFVGLQRLWSSWELLSLRHQRNLITYILELLVTTIILGFQLSVTTLIGNPDDLDASSQLEQLERAERYVFTPLVLSARP
jgi:hypothetical protein